MTTKDCPLEEYEQRQFTAYLQRRGLLANHSPNEGKRNVIQGHRLKMVGMSKGHPDYMIYIARQGYHGLVIEMKRQHGGKLTDEQEWWLKSLNANGYKALRADGCAHAIQIVEDYLGKDYTPVYVKQALEDYDIGF